MAREKPWSSFVWLLSFFVLIICLRLNCIAQEAGSIDLTQITPRIDLRRPPARPGDSAQRGGAIAHHHPDCGAGKQSSAVQTTLLWLDRSEYGIGEEPKFQVRITNVGSSSLRIPFSPHLADLQPANASEKFAYSKMTIELYIGGKTWDSNTGGQITLFGADTLHGTILTLQPGEWVDVIGKGHIMFPENLSPVLLARDPMTRVNARIQIDQDEMLVTSSQSAIVSNQICLSEQQGPSLQLKITGGGVPR